MNRFKSVEFFHVVIALQLNHIIDTTFSSIEKFEPFDRYTTLQSLYKALDHQLQDGLMYAVHSREVVGLEAANP